MYVLGRGVSRWGGLLGEHIACCRVCWQCQSAGSFWASTPGLGELALVIGLGPCVRDGVLHG